MATAEKGSLLKNVKVKIKDKDDKDKETGSNIEINFNISGEEEKDKASSQEDKKEIVNDKLDISEHEENSKIIKEKSEEKNNSQNSSEEEKKSEKKSEYNYKNTNEKEGSNNLKESKDSKGSHSGSENNNKSSFLNSNHYNNLQNENENENDNLELNDSNEEENDSCFIDRSKPFMTTGKFMQIQPHFNIFSQQVEDLHNGIYENTKKCLIYKSSLQDSENLIREKANSVVRDLVDKIFNLRQMFLNANKTISMTINEVNQNVIKVTEMQARTKKEINDCDHRINDCEGQIGYKLLGKPNYSFMKRMYQTK